MIEIGPNLKNARRVLSYEVPSETPPDWVPTVFRPVNRIEKAAAMGRYYPGEAIVPRDSGAIMSLASMRGGQSGLAESEAFRLWYER